MSEVRAGDQGIVRVSRGEGVDLSVEDRDSASMLMKVHVRLPGKGNSNSHGARLVHLIIMMMKWIRTSRLSIKNSL